MRSYERSPQGSVARNGAPLVPLNLECDIHHTLIAGERRGSQHAGDVGHTDVGTSLATNSTTARIPGITPCSGVGEPELHAGSLSRSAVGRQKYANSALNHCIQLPLRRTRHRQHFADMQIAVHEASELHRRELDIGNR